MAPLACLCYAVYVTCIDLTDSCCTDYVVDYSSDDSASNDEACQTNWDWKRDMMLMQEYLGLSAGL